MADNTGIYFEDFLKASGWGLYCKFNVGMISFCNFVQGVTFGIFPMALALSTCDRHFIPEVTILRIFTSFLIGSCFGGLLANFFSDIYGRKRYQTYSLMFIFMSTFSAGFAYNPYVIIGTAFFLGIGLESNVVVSKLLLSEVLPSEKRGFYTSFVHIFWNLGYVTTIVLTITLETQSVFDLERSTEMRLASWRIMFATCGGLNIFVACACALLEESPRFFLYLGKTYMGYLILKQLYAVNNSSHAESFKVKEDDIKGIIETCDFAYEEHETHWDTCKFVTKRFMRSSKMMFSKRFFNTTWALILIKMPTLMVGILQLNIVLAKQLTIADGYLMLGGLDFIYPVLYPSVYYPQINQNQSVCKNNQDSALFYRNLLILTPNALTGSIFCLSTIDTCGRKCTLFLNLLVTSCSFMTLAYLENTTAKIIFTSLTITAVSCVITALSIASIECYPTSIRGTASGIINSFGLFGAIFFVNFVAIDQKIFCIVMGLVYFGLSIFSCFLPELKRKPMVE